MYVIKNYLDPNDRDPFGQWFDEVEARAAAKVRRAIIKIENGNLGNTHPVGFGREVREIVIDIGPGYRVYFAQDGNEVIILLAGGTKQRQQRDIDIAHERWADYKRRKRG